MGLVDPAGLFFIESDCSFREVTGRGPGQRVRTRVGLALICFDGRDGIAAVLRSSDDHIDSSAAVVVARLAFFHVFLPIGSLGKSSPFE